LIDREVTDASLAFLDKVAADHTAGRAEPFALSVGYMFPHHPYVADPDLYAYDEGQVGPPRLPRAEAGQHGYLEHWRAQTGLNDITPADEMRARTACYAMCEPVDRMVGELLDRLDTLGLAENTLVV